jgi:hypothetical protein
MMLLAKMMGFKILLRGAPRYRIYSQKLRRLAAIFLPEHGQTDEATIHTQQTASDGEPNDCRRLVTNAKKHWYEKSVAKKDGSVKAAVAE